MQVKNHRRTLWLTLAIAAITLVGGAYAALPGSSSISTDSRSQERTIRAWCRPRRSPSSRSWTSATLCFRPETTSCSSTRSPGRMAPWQEP